MLMKGHMLSNFLKKIRNSLLGGQKKEAFVRCRQVTAEMIADSLIFGENTKVKNS